MKNIILEHKKLESEMQAIMEKMESIEKQDEYKKNLKCKEDIEKTLSENGKKTEDLLYLFPEILPEKLNNKKIKRSRKPSQLIRYKHPETGDVVESRSLNNKTLKAWVEKYGKDTVKSWGEPVNDEVDSH